MSPTWERPPWLVSVRRTPDGEPVGAGLLITPRHILTCAHVVRPGRSRTPPTEPVHVRFQFTPEHDPLPATVVPGGWHPDTGDDIADIAVLELGAPAPEGAAPAPLRTTDPGTWGHRFRAYGYPDEHRRHGVPVRGEIIGDAGVEWLQVEASPLTGYGLEKGFSGSPVWDVNTQGVVGMMVARDQVTAVDRRTAYAVRVETLTRYWPDLGPYVKDATTAELRDRLESLLWVPLTGDGEIPRVAEVDPHDIGVSPSKYTGREGVPPYVRRHPQDAELDALLADRRFVLLAGPSKAGKSRGLYEALMRTMPGARLVVPRADAPHGRVLDDLSRLRLPVGGAEKVVLWLDDLHRYLQPGGLDLQILDRFARQHPAVTVVATIAAKHRAALAAMENDVGRVTRTVLNKADLVTLTSRLGPEDAALARELYPREDFGVRGIGELMVAAPALEERFTDGAESCPPGWAVAKAAADWLRMGLTEPIPDGALRDLFTRYMADHHPESDAGEEAYRTGLAWAREPVAGTIALLQRAPAARPDPSGPAGEDAAPAYLAVPYMTEYLDTHGDDPAAAVPASAWEYAAGTRTAAELLPVACTALLRDEAAIGDRMLQAIAQTAEDRDISAWASLMLGEMYLYLADYPAACRWLEAAAASGADSVVPLAQVELAEALMVTGDRERARQLLERAVSSRDPQVSQLAQIGLAAVLFVHGETPRAQRLLESVIAAGDVEVAPLAQARLVRALTDGDAAGVRARPDGKHGKARPVPAAPRGAAQPDPVEQPWTLSRAVGESIAGQITEIARVTLGGLLVNQGELDRGEELLRSVLDGGQFHAVPVAQVGLGELLILRGRYEEAYAVLRALIATGNPQFTPLAQFVLALGLLRQDDPEPALALFREVAESGHPDQAPRAVCALGEWYTSTGDREAAEEWLHRAVGTGHPDWSHAARIALAVVHARLTEDGMERAEQLLAEVVAAGHHDQAPRAADFLGDFLAEQGRTDEAEAAYRAAIDSGHQQWSPIAGIDLAAMLAAAGRDADAADRFTAVMESGHPDQAPRAADLFGDFLAEQGRPEEAEAAYRAAIDSGHEQWSLIARIDLAVLLADHDDYARAETLLRVVAESGDPQTSVWGRALLGMVLVYGGGRRAEGMAHLREVADADAVPASQMARFQLAKLLVDDGDEDGAEELLWTVVNGERSDITEVARAYLAVLLLRRRGEDAAEELLVAVEDSGVPEAIALAYLGAGSYLLDNGEIQASAELLEAALEIGDPETAPQAGMLLGVVRRSTNDLESARQLLTDALESGDPDVEPQARRYLGSTLFRLGLLAEAEETLLPLARSDDAEHRPQALLLLGQVLAAADRREDAYPWFEAALGCGDPDTEASARYTYAELLQSAGLLARAAEVLASGPQEPPGMAALTADGAPARPEAARPGPPREEQPPAEAPVPAPPHPLPPRVLTLLGDIADAEGAAAEAAFWYALAARR